MNDSKEKSRTNEWENRNPETLEDAMREIQYLRRSLETEKAKYLRAKQDIKNYYTTRNYELKKQISDSNNRHENEMINLLKDHMAEIRKLEDLNTELRCTLKNLRYSAQIEDERLKNY